MVIALRVAHPLVATAANSPTAWPIFGLGLLAHVLANVAHRRVRGEWLVFIGRFIEQRHCGHRSDDERLHTNDSAERNDRGNAAAARRRDELEETSREKSEDDRVTTVG